MSPVHIPPPEPPSRSPRPWWLKALVRFARQWLVFLAGRYRERAARCKVCGHSFEWESRGVTVPPMCPGCLARRQWLATMPCEFDAKTREGVALHVTIKRAGTERYSITLSHSGRHDFLEGPFELVDQVVLQLLEGQMPETGTRKATKAGKLRAV